MVSFTRPTLRPAASGSWHRPLGGRITTRCRTLCTIVTPPPAFAVFPASPAARCRGRPSRPPSNAHAPIFSPRAASPPDRLPCTSARRTSHQRPRRPTHRPDRGTPESVRAERVEIAVMRTSLTVIRPQTRSPNALRRAPDTKCRVPETKRRVRETRRGETNDGVSDAKGVIPRTMKARWRRFDTERCRNAAPPNPGRRTNPRSREGATSGVWKWDGAKFVFQSTLPRGSD